MDCCGIFWQLPTTRTSDEPREPESSVFLCVVESPTFLLEEVATLKRALPWDAVVAGVGVGVGGQVQMHQGLQGHRDVIWNGWGRPSRFKLF